MDLTGQLETPNRDGHSINVFGAVRLLNGDTLIASGNNNRVFEVTPEGKTVWSIERDELPGTISAGSRTSRFCPTAISFSATRTPARTTRS
jgi:hypothetical protein